MNAAGNYTKPSLRKSIVSQVKSAATHGTGAGQWSARKAQLLAKTYKARGGGYKWFLKDKRVREEAFRGKTHQQRWRQWQDFGCKSYQ